MRIARVLVAALSVALLGPLAGTLASPARAADLPAITLEASASQITFGEAVTLSGAVTPAAVGATVELRDPAEAVVATAMTDAAGAFSVELAPEANLTLHAASNGVVSEPVTVGVHAVVTVRLPPVRLFHTVTVTGTVSPPVAGAAVRVRLTVAGRRVATRRPTILATGAFRTTFRVDRPGTYRAWAVFRDDAHRRGAAVDGPESTPLPSLREGSAGAYVRFLERRLVELHYRLVGVDDTYDFRTADAVLAFRKVQGMSRTPTVDEVVWRRLSSPLVPKPRLKTKALHVEVDQTRQVLYTVVGDEITNIIHVSTGKASTPTRDGSFQVRSKVAGYTSKRLYYANFFDGERAIHGWLEVPTYPASHGCVRVPYWHAQWIFGLTPVGTRVLVYHS